MSVVSRWKELFCNLLNRPLRESPDILLAEADATMPETWIVTCPPTILETYAAVRKIEAGKALGPCGIYAEYIHHGGRGTLTSTQKAHLTSCHSALTQRCSAWTSSFGSRESQ